MSSITQPILPVSGRFQQLAWRLAQLFETERSNPLPAELRRLPEHLLRDIGLDRADLPPTLDDYVARADMLESHHAIATYLSSTVR